MGGPAPSAAGAATSADAGSKLHGQVAAIALAPLAEHGFALGGGNALIAHGIIQRPTEDVDVFTDMQGGVEAAADAVDAALRDAGFGTERRDKTAGLADIFDGMGEGMAEWIIAAPGGEQVMLQMAYFDRARTPVTMDVGPVLHLEDVVGGKVCALASRAEHVITWTRRPQWSTTTLSR